MKFLKNNPILALGLALPVAMLLIFWVSLVLNKIAVDDPKHDAIFWTNGSYNNNNTNDVELRFKTVKGILKAQYRNKQSKNYYYKPILYRFYAKGQIVRPIRIEIPDENATDQWQDIEIEELTLDTSYVAPDGYTFIEDGYNYRGRGIAGDIFGFGYNSRGKYYILSKDGRTISVNNTNGRNYYGGKSNFVGWVK